MCQDWISIIITRHGPMRVETSIGRDSGSRRGHEHNYGFRVRIRVRVRVSGSRGSTRKSIFWVARHMCSHWISIIITRHGPMRVETSIGRDSGSRRTHEQN